MYYSPKFVITFCGCSEIHKITSSLQLNTNATFIICKLQYTQLQLSGHGTSTGVHMAIYARLAIIVISSNASVQDATMIII